MRPTAPSGCPRSSSRPRRAGPRRPVGSTFSAHASRRRGWRRSVLCSCRARPDVVADRDPVEAAVDGPGGRSRGARHDALGREHHLVVAELVGTGVESGSARTTRPTARESLAPVNAMSGSTPSRVGSMFSDGSAPSTLDADLLEAEAADRRCRRSDVAALGRDGVAVGHARAERLGDEDLVLVDTGSVGALSPAR